MRSAAIRQEAAPEVNILARVLGNEAGELPSRMARHILSCGFGEGDKARMHDLVVRNQDDRLSAGEREELAAYAKAGTLLSILKSKARRALRAKNRKAS